MIKVRKDEGTPESREARPLKSFLEGQYVEMAELSLPKVNYVTFTASSSTEVSVETKEYGGIFTFSFIKALERAKRVGRIPSYSELFATTKSILKSNLFAGANEQTPQVEFLGNVSLHDTFLDLGEKQLINLPEVVFRDNEWKIGIGAIHGAKIPNDSNFVINIYSKTEEEGKEILKREGSVRPIRLEVEYIVVKEVTAKLNTQETYFAEFSGDKLPLYINGKDVNRGVKNLIHKELVKPSYKSSFQIEEEESTEYQLWITEDTLEIRKEGELVYGVRDHSPEAVKHICAGMRKVSKWIQLLSLQTPKNSKINSDKVKLILSYEEDEEDVKFSSGKDPLSEDILPSSTTVT